MPDGTQPVPGGWNRLHLQVDDLAGEVQRLRAADLRFRNDIISGPGGSQILLEDPSRQRGRAVPARPLRSPPLPWGSRQGTTHAEAAASSPGGR